LLDELSDFILGALFGLSGLAPFFHVNTVVELVKNWQFTSFELFAVALVFSRLPFEFLAATNANLYGEDTAVAGTNYRSKSLKTNLLHCVCAMLISLALFPVYSIFASEISPAIKPFLPMVLIGIYLWFLVRQENKIDALIISLLAGGVGIITLDKNLNNALFILLSGLFALPELFVPTKEDKETNDDTNPVGFTPKIAVIGSIISTLSAFFPAMTPAVLSVVSLGFLEKNDDKFAAMNSSILGSRAVSDFAGIEYVGKGRSGATAAIIERTSLNFSQIYFLVAAGILVAAISAIVVNRLGKKLPKIELGKKERIGIILLMFLYVLYSSNIIGVVAFATCGLVGLTCKMFGTSRAVLGAAVLFASLKNYF